METLLAALSPIALYIFVCTGAADGITEVRIQTDVLSFMQNGKFHFLASPPLKTKGGTDVAWIGPNYPGRWIMFSIKGKPNKLLIVNGWDGTTAGHKKGDFTIADTCRRKKPS